MVELVDPRKIEKIVGIQRHPNVHYGRANFATETVYILHSEACRATGRDLRACDYSIALSYGINDSAWWGKFDQPVVLTIVDGRLVPEDRLDHE